MINVSAIALTALITWALVLLITMEVARARLVISGAVASNEFRPDNSNLSPFMQRLSRAFANCVEGLPIFGGLLVIALLTDRTDITDPLAPWLLVARVIQSSVHLASLNVMAVNLRFAAFAVQLVIAGYWATCLLLFGGGS